MKNKVLMVIFFLTVLNCIVLVYGNIRSTDDGFLIDDPTAGIMRYRYEESWKWNPNPMLWLTSILLMIMINLAILLSIVVAWKFEKPCNDR